MNAVVQIMQAACLSQGRALEYYWPGDAVGSNDLVENNLAFHVAHTAMVQRYAVFAEARYPGPDARRIDLLAVAGDRTHFIAAEFKQHQSAGMADSREDVERLTSFHLNCSLLPERCGASPLRVLSECKEGIGLVAGLKWYTGDSEPVLDADATASRVRELGGEVRVQVAYPYDVALVHGAYWLQYAFFPLQGVR